MAEGGGGACWKGHELVLLNLIMSRLSGTELNGSLADLIVMAVKGVMRHKNTLLMKVD